MGCLAEERVKRVVWSDIARNQEKHFNEIPVLLFGCRFI